MEVSYHMSEKAIASIGDKQIIIEAGKLAKQADGAVTVQLGETIVIVAAVAALGRLDGLLAEFELLGDGLVAVDVYALEVIQQPTTLADHHQQPTAGAVVFLVLL